MAYDFLIALIKNVEGILLEPDHQMVPVIRNRNGDKHQIHINLERGAAAVGWPNVSRRRVLDNSWCDVDVPLTVLTETDRKSSREAECLCKKARHLQRKASRVPVCLSGSEQNSFRTTRPKPQRLLLSSFSR
jgi:hypothetical protein